MHHLQCTGEQVRGGNRGAGGQRTLAYGPLRGRYVADLERYELVAHTTDGHNPVRLAGVFLNFSSEVGDMYLDQMGIVLVLVPHPVQELLVAENSSRFVSQGA